MNRSQAYAALLQWQAEAGADEAIGEVAFDRRAEMAAPKNAPSSPALAPAAAPADVDAIAAGAGSIEELAAILETFDGCALKKTASRLCLGDGVTTARLMLVGEGPGREEDLQGKPFVGRAGQLLDRMLNAIGHDRTSVYITNCVFWRPPGNRTPTPEETAVCRPFLDRQIEIVAPDVIIMLGAVAAQTLTGRKEGITKLRGRWFDIDVGGRQIPALAALHPAYLLRQPGQKKFAWRDMLAAQRKLEEKAGSA
ncbi:MAG: uracil-DNA glycosylase [Rhodobiaceae bacterium]|nr:uracil-DNA glycosylase [Rhodobiaceae bacterium]MCC0054813.1 uracil-DNA glycosylase [Rhodobiaceae bacterium]